MQYVQYAFGLWDQAQDTSRQRIERSWKLAEDTRDWLLRAVLIARQLLLLFGVLLCSSLVLYLLLYNLLVPTALHQAPLFFDYGEPNTKTSPTAAVDFLAEHKGWEATELAVQGKATKRLLAPGQKYDFVVSLELPQSPTNYDIGKIGCACA